ncbi:hypothetical protein [Thermogutta sp.]|uniref:hypothetical protein n=1 Tax=Thermogutta sp. TaxID=1962930 RepID=UPI0032207114
MTKHSSEEKSPKEIFFVLALLVGGVVTCVGFTQAGLFRQATWRPEGLASLAALEIPVLALALACRFMAGAQGWLPWVSCLVGAIVLFGAGAVLSVGGIVVGAWALGDLLWPSARDRLPVDWFPVVAVYGFGILAITVSALLHFPINSPLFYGALGLFIGFLQIKRLKELCHGLKARWQNNASTQAAEGRWPWIIGGILLVHAAVAALPERGHDALAMHLFIPSYVYYHGSWSFDAANFAFAVMPLGADSLFTVAFLFAGEKAARLLNFAFFTLTVWLLHRALRAVCKGDGAYMLTALFCTIPLAFLVNVTLFVENALAMFFVAAITLVLGYFDMQISERVRVVALICSAALATKATAIFFVVPVMVIAFVLIFSQSRRAIVDLGASVGFLLPGVHPYLYAWIATGNPVFPFFNAMFRSPLFVSDKNFANTLFPGGLSWDLLYRYTFYSGRYLEGQNGVFGFQFLTFVFAALWSLWRYRSRRGALAFIVTVLFVVGVSAGTQYIRYLFPILGVFTIVVAEAFRAEMPLTRSVVSGFSWVLMGMNLWFAPGASWQLSGFDVRAAISKNKAEELVRMSVGAKVLNKVVSALAPEGRVAYFGGFVGVDLKPAGLSASWYNSSFWHSLLRAKDLPDVMEVFRARAITHAVVQDGSLRWMPAVGELLSVHGREVERVGGAVLYRISPEVSYGPRLDPSGSSPRLPSEGNSLDLGSGNQQSWVFLLKPGTKFLWVETAYRCSNDQTWLGVQVNWLGKGGQGMGVVSSIFGCQHLGERKEGVEFRVPESAEGLILSLKAPTAGAVTVLGTAVRTGPFPASPGDS